jgi:SAM-dependent methyltransferase
VACGTGVVARLAAERIRTGRVIGLDLNTGMLAVARSLPSGADSDEVGRAFRREVGHAFRSMSATCSD